VIRRRRKTKDGVAKLLADTQDMVGKLVRENRTLKARNARLMKELDRVSAGWDEIKKLARQAPRRPRG
jgi:cell division protein FtsB